MSALEYSLTHLAATVAALLDLPAPALARAEPLTEIVADLGHVPAVAIIAPDALGLYPLQLWSHELPTLSSWHEQRSLVLRAVMPTITPVNFATMITGVEQTGHGIQTFKDSFECETLFDVVRAHGGQSAGVGRQGYTGSELLGRHADLWGTAENKSDEEVECLTLTFARESRPQFMIVQFGATDDIFHQYGPTSSDVVPTLRELDARLGRVVGELRRLGYGVIVTADHGQHDKTEGPGGTHGTPADEDALVPCTWLEPLAGG
jgi:predicted AlkP superfamily pyrophosphatase or phosphodiesterase